MVAGLLASGISVNGLQPSHNPQVAAQMFTTATRLDPEMCDAWLARLLAGDQSIEVLSGAWAAVKTFGWETRRLGVTDLQFRPEVSDGLFLRLAVTSVESLAALTRPCSPRRSATKKRPNCWTASSRAIPSTRSWSPTCGGCCTSAPGVGPRCWSSSRGHAVAQPRAEGRGRGDGDHRAGLARGVRGGLPARPGGHRGGPGAGRGQHRHVHPGHVPAARGPRRRGRRAAAPGVLAGSEVHPGPRSAGQPQLSAGADRPGNHRGPHGSVGSGKRTHPRTDRGRTPRRGGREVLGRRRRRAQRDARHGAGQTGNQAHQVDDQGEPGPRENGAPGAGDVATHACCWDRPARARRRWPARSASSCAA